MEITGIFSLHCLLATYAAFANRNPALGYVIKS